MVSIDQFHNIEMRVGTILSAEVVEGADKLLKLSVDFGEENGPRQIVSGVRKFYAPDDLVGKQCPFVVNLAPRTIRGLESNGMILAVGTIDEDGNRGCVLLHPDRAVENGSGLS